MAYEKELQDYDEKGYCVVSGFFSAAEIRGFKDALEAFVNEKAGTLGGRHINYSGEEINSIHALALEQPDGSFFSNFLQSDRMRSFAGVFLRSGPKGRACEFFAKPARVGLPSPLHQDNAYWCVANNNALTIWIALDRSTPANGGVTYYIGSQKLGNVPHVPSYAPGSSQKIADESLARPELRECPSLEPGDILVHGVLVIHGSDANKTDQSRRGLTLQYVDASSDYDQEMKRKYEANLEMQIRARNAGAANAGA